MMVRAGRQVSLRVAVAALSVGIFAAMDSPVAQATPAAGQAWPVPGPAGIPGSLFGVSADSATDAWAVGQYFNSADVSQTLIAHWNGTTWRRVPSPDPTPDGDGLAAVSAVSSTDAWAVGSAYDKTTNATSTLILHWNGTAWSPVNSPNPSAQYNVLAGVSAVSRTDAWAVGDYETQNGLNNTSLVLHWNGTAWSRVKVPSHVVGTALNDVSAVSRTDVWAVGTIYDKSLNSLASLALHWNGTAWSKVTTPTAPGNTQLSSVSAVSSADAWATGDVTLRWNGTAWAAATLPPLSRSGYELDGVSAVSGADAWIVGWDEANTKFNPRFTVTLRWNGTAWKRVPSPDPGTIGGEGLSQLFGVTALSSTDAWAVGTYYGPTDKALILHWNGTTWSVV